MPVKRCMEPSCRQLVRLEDWQEHRNGHRGNTDRGWSARNRSDQRRFRREVLDRDGWRRTKLLDNGLRCGATDQLVAHHLTPLHKGGTFDPAGGVTLCGSTTSWWTAMPDSPGRGSFDEGARYDAGLDPEHPMRGLWIDGMPTQAAPPDRPRSPTAQPGEVDG